MSFPNAHFTAFSKSPLAYKQYAPDDAVQSSLYDVNMECDASLRYQNRKILLVDSKDRNRREEPNKYRALLNKEYKDVITIELVNACVPNSDYIVNEFNNNFYFQDSSEQLNPTCGRPYHRIQLPIGDYPIDHECDDSIRSLLEQALNSVDPDNAYTVLVDPNQRTFTITQTAGSGIFNILFQHPQCCQGEPKGKENPLPHSMGEILGFKTYNNKTGHTTYTGEYSYDLRPCKYIIMRMNNKERGWQRMDSNHDPAQNGFAILPLDVRVNNFKMWDDCDDLNKEQYKIHFNPPIPTFDRLNLEFIDQDGNPYNFRGKNHVLVFEVTSLSQHSDYYEGSHNVNKVTV